MTIANHTCRIYQMFIDPNTEKPTAISCQREEFHDGYHQAVRGNLQYTWDINFQNVKVVN